MRRCVWSRKLVNEEAMTHWGLSRQNKTIIHNSGNITDKQTNKQTLPLGSKYLDAKNVFSVACNKSGVFNPLNTELSTIWHLLALLGAHPILYISKIRVEDIFFLSFSYTISLL
jgi:hypothetical protein